MKVLIACEESQTVCKAFREKGHEAFSCDIQDCSGGFPQWHFKDDIFKVINGSDWDMMIAFPPCTHLAVSGSRHFEKKRQDGRQKEGIDFFIKIANSDIHRIAIENPIGIMSSVYRKPDQIIQPYYFKEPSLKSTCLWLKNLPKLFHAKREDLFNYEITHVEPVFVEYNSLRNKSGKSKYNPDFQSGKDRSKIRSKTFQGIAKAMAEQWG